MSSKSTADQTPLIIISPDAIAKLLAPYLDDLAEKALAKALSRSQDDGRLVSYEEARAFLGMGKTRFSQAVADGAIPHYPNGNRKLFKMADLRAFEGYKPESQAEKQFKIELQNR